MPEARLQENLKTEEKEIVNSPEGDVLASVDGPTSINDIKVNGVEVKEKKLLGLGVMGATGVMLAIIAAVVVLGSVALSPRRKGRL
jgi:hypothetical protein